MPDPARSVDFARVLTTTLRLCREQASTMLLACAIAILPFTAIDLVCALAEIPPPSALNFVSALANFWLYATLAHLTLPAYEGRPLSFQQASAAAVPVLGSMFLLSLLQGLGVLIGVLLFVVPGVWFWVASYLAVPVALFEGLRGTAAITRSMELTRNARLPIFLIGVMTTLLLGAAVGAIIVPIVLAAAADPSFESPGAMGGADLVSILMSAVVHLVWSLLGTVAMTVVYAEAREPDAAAQARAVAEVFS